LAQSNAAFSDQDIAAYVEKEYDDGAAQLAAAVMFDAPTANGLPMATVSITRTYRLPYEEAKAMLKNAM